MATAWCGQHQETIRSSPSAGARRCGLSCAAPGTCLRLELALLSCARQMQVLALLALEGTVTLRESWDSDIAADFAHSVDKLAPEHAGKGPASILFRSTPW